MWKSRICEKTARNFVRAAPHKMDAASFGQGEIHGVGNDIRVRSQYDVVDIPSFPARGDVGREAEAQPGGIAGQGRQVRAGGQEAIAVATKGESADRGVVSERNVVIITICRHQGTELVDLQGGLLVPGFIGNHTHFLEGGFRLVNDTLQLRELMRSTGSAGLHIGLHAIVLTWLQSLSDLNL
ncbi:MAG: hypothetical protein J5I98_32210 [Phaeodactylibacter sp.]|nr:hypothetical protein [Phaeodactylibacter sp.]